MNLLDVLNAHVPDWMADGLCAQTDPELFFPEKGGSSRHAKETCLVCPVRVECLQHALDNHEAFGIWGGVSERDRRKLRRQQQATPTTTSQESA